MSTYSVAQVTADVRRRLNHNAPAPELIAADDLDTLLLDDRVRELLLPTLTDLYLAVPYTHLCFGHHFGQDVGWHTGGSVGAFSGWVPLPDDYLRLVVFQMSDWERPVVEAQTIDHPSYLLQRSAATGLRGTPERPRCFIAVRPEGLVLEFYSCLSQQATVGQALYQPRPTFITPDHVDIPPLCYHPLIGRLAAALTANG
ncbi:MAG: hypothetical protein LIO90_05935 [Bacteroidales bacterium]|nr:hypothetical protein [Bacteroidales bacterium]